MVSNFDLGVEFLKEFFIAANFEQILPPRDTLCVLWAQITRDCHEKFDPSSKICSL